MSHNFVRMKCGSLEFYDKQYDRVTTKNEKRLQRISRIFHKVTTTDDPVIRQVSSRVLMLKLFSIWTLKCMIARTYSGVSFTFLLPVVLE